MVEDGMMHHVCLVVWMHSTCMEDDGEDCMEKERNGARTMEVSVPRGDAGTRCDGDLQHRREMKTSKE